MRELRRSMLLAAVIFVGAAVAVAAREAPRVQISVGATDVNPGDVLTLPDTAVADTSEPLVLTIANEGDAALELPADDPPELSGDGEFMFFLDTSETAEVVQPGESTTLEVVFFPSAAGKQEATLTINTNDPSVPVFAVTFSGNAVASSDDFGSGGD